jgi:superfamily II RNA helicase
MNDLDRYSLGVMAAAIVFEPRKNQSAPTLSKTYRPLRRSAEDICLKIKNKELRYRIYPTSKPAYFHLSASMEAWMKGQDFDAILKLTDTDEGELVRYFRMSIQILREMQDTPLGPGFKERLKETIRAINRDIVDAEKQLREG